MSVLLEQKNKSIMDATNNKDPFDAVFSCLQEISKTLKQQDERLTKLEKILEL